MTTQMEPRLQRPIRTLEYRAYYTIIFIAALPVACLKWLSELPESKAARASTPVGAARVLTATVLPYIFMA